MMNAIYNMVKRVVALALAVTLLSPATQAQEAMHLFYKNGKHEIIEMTPDTKVEFYKQPYVEEIYYTAGGDTIYISASSGRTMNYGNVVANVPWTIAIDADWMMARRSSKLESWSYRGDGMIEEPFLLFVESNKTGELRTAKVTISTAFGVAKEFVVAQLPFMLSLERLGDHYGLEPTTTSENIMEWTDTILEVSVYPDFDVKVLSYPDWMTLDTLWYYSDWFSLEKVAQVPDSIRVTGEGFGSGYSYARFRFTPNESPEARTGNIIFEGNGQTAVLTVTQKGLNEETIVGYATNLAKKLYGYNMSGINNHSDFGYPALMLAMESRGTDLVSESLEYNWFRKQMSYGDLNSSHIYTYMHWTTLYNVIIDANKAWQDFGERREESLFQFYLAQASALRAFSYFYLAQLYQQTYVGNEDQPCVPIVSGAYQYIVEKEQCPRATVREVYDYILQDLDMAEHLLSETTVANVGKYLVTRQVINGLRARVYMVMNEWEKAAEYAQRVIDSGIAKPYTMDEVRCPTFNDINHSAWLWGIEGDDTMGYVSWSSHMGSFTYGYAQVGGVWRKVSQSLYQTIPSTDVRKGWFLDANRVSGNLNDEQQAYVLRRGLSAYTQVKFAPENGVTIGTEQKKGNGADIPLMRIEEMYLILAEAQGMMGNAAAGAATLQNFVATYRDPAYVCTATTAEEMQNAVWMQRRIELWGEGHSYFDLMRMKKGVDRRGAGFQSGYVYNIPAGDAALIYPIPASQMNNNMSLVQNPEAEIPVAVKDESESHSYKSYCSGVFASGLFGSSWSQDMEVATDDNTVYRLPGYIAEGYDLNFIWDAEKGVVEVARTTWQTGYEHPTYGMVSATCQSVGYNAETKTFTFVIEYTCSAGSFGTYNETYTISDVYSATARRAQQATQKEIKPITLELK